MPLKRVFAVDIGTHSVKVIEVTRGREGFRVRRVGQAETAGGAEIADAVRKAMRVAHVRRGACVVGLPRSQVVLRRLRNLPKGLEEAELRNIALLQAESELPFPPGTAVFDFTNIQRTDAGASLEVIAAEIEEVEAYLTPVREAGGRPLAVMPSVFGLAMLVRYHFARNGGSHRVLALSIGHTTTDVALVHGDRVVFSRSFPVGAREIQKSPLQGLQQFLDQLRLTVRAYQRDLPEEAETDLAPFETIWLFGGGATLALQVPGENGVETTAVPLSQVLEEQFSVPVRAAFPIDGCEDAGPLTQDARGWATYGTALGYALAALEEAIPVNLLPAVERKKRAQAERNRRLVVLAGSAATLFLLIFLVSNRLQARYLSRIRALDAEIEQYRQPRAQATAAISELRALSGALQPRYTQLDVLREVTAILPDRRPIAATAFTVEPSGKVTISFDAESHEAVTSAVTRLSRSAWFTNVVPGSIVTTQKGNRQVRQFTITMQLAQDADVLAAKRVGTPYEPSEEEQTAQGGPGGGRFGGFGGPQQAGFGGFPGAGFSGRRSDAAEAPGDAFGSGRRSGRGAARERGTPTDRLESGETLGPAEKSLAPEGNVEVKIVDEAAEKLVIEKLEAPPEDKPVIILEEGDAVAPADK
ncbi:MAG: hypothetical protein KatS3mg115_1531 [Candidatus Poribacteria bacterium]|nr:MAG: hypothetical protein KatS3mg115_1531 [Candidatus Poribacteria bacterium]